MYKVKYLNSKTGLIEWRTYKGRDREQVRAIASNMRNLTWIGIYADEEIERLR